MSRATKTAYAKWEGIVKVQLPLMTNDPCPQALVYDESRRLITEVDAELVEALSGGRMKFFANAKLENKVLTLLSVAPDQSW